MGSPLSALTSWAVDVIESLGYIGIALIVTLENVIPPIPSEVVLPMAGYLVGQGRLEFFPVIIAATTGSVAGALILYGLGYWVGEQRLVWVLQRFGKFVLMDEEDLLRSRRWFVSYGSTAVLVGRLIPGVRSLISVPAGMFHMPLGRFVLYTAAGSAVWNVLLVSVGWVLGSEWERVEDYVAYLEYIVYAAILVGGVWFLWSRKDRLRRMFS
jgi:membrane protein DedA with SNARE-associated domain